jgi:hypothetical protein
MLAGPHVERLVTEQTSTSLPKQEIHSNSPIIKEEEQSHDVLGSWYNEERACTADIP